MRLGEVMDISFKDKKVIVTAGTEGLGRATVEAFIKAGARVATCARSDDKLASLKEAFGDQILVHKVDLLDASSTKSFTETAAKELGGVDSLIFNPPHSVKVPIPDLSIDDWKKSFDAIYSSMIAATEGVLPALLQSGSGSLTVISSLAAIEPIDIMPASSVLRSGIAAWVKLMTREYGPKGLRFNAIMPGFMDTTAVRKGMKKKAAVQGKSEDQVIEEFTQNVPLRRLGKPAEIAQAALFLSSDAASFISGTTLLVDGGLVRGV